MHKPDLTELLAQLVREEFGLVLPEKSEEPHPLARIDAVVDALAEPAAPREMAQTATTPRMIHRLPAAQT